MDLNDAAEAMTENGQVITITTSETADAGVMSTFLGELARAMQDAAQRERERIADVATSEAALHVERTRRRAASETEALRRLAEQDVERIQAWQAAEMERIRAEGERRVAERRNDLEVYVAQHDAIISVEIDAVDGALREYRDTLGRFFDDLATTTDPADIARRAGSLPQLPNLDEVRAAARADAVAQVANGTRDATGGATPVDGTLGEGPSTEAGAGVGVMDPDAAAPEREPVAVGDLVESLRTTGPGIAAADPLYVAAEEPAAADDASTERESAAVRVLRTFAPWAASPDRDGAQQDRP